MLAIVADILAGSGKCFSVGFNKYGELGLGHTLPVEKFTPVPSFDSTSDISAGQHVSFFVDQNHKLYSCGIKTLHGNAATDNQILPQPVSDQILAGIGCQISR